MHTTRFGHSVITANRWLPAAVLVTLLVVSAQAQTARIRFRPLTPQEIKNAGLTNTTQKSTGAPNAGLGQPVYLEALLTNGQAAALVSVNWTLVSAPSNSLAVITTGPLSNSVPTYDGGDRLGYFVAGRAMFKPDIVSSFDFDSGQIIDYDIRTDIVLTNTTIRLTNSVYGARYIGQRHYLCQLCHADKQALFNQTDHATAFTRQITGQGSDHFNSRCISCHTLGYDTTPEAVNDGFDDIATSVGWTFPTNLVEENWTLMNTNLQNKANVQCESCHGAASAHMVSLGNTNAIDITLSSGTCGTCHDSLPQHVKTFEWFSSRHSTGYVFRFSGSCVPCHSSAGFIETWDPYYAPSNRTPRATAQEGISCAACHDPHSIGMGEHQLRNITTALLSNGVVVTEAQAGTGVLCMNCHHSRQKADSAVVSSSISPHYGTQGDMLMGENGFEYGMPIPSSKHLAAVTNSCVGCHMQLIAQTAFSNANTKVGGHTFKIAWDGGTPENEADDVMVTEVCKTCHVGVYNTFDFGGGDYDRDGSIEGVQSEIKGMLEKVSLLLPPLGSTSITFSAGSYTPAQRKAYWNYQFVKYDGSYGVHNPKYASTLLQLALDDLGGGIDIDNDGLLDSWEVANFGDITSQTGDGDYDNDGLTNKMEMQAGTDPKDSDSDNDGFSDLAELQGGSDPLEMTSGLDTNLVGMIPAVELEYFPSTLGVTQRFQAISAMGDSAWTNIGASFISSNAFSYQLMSLRNSTQMYFRVIKP